MNIQQLKSSGYQLLEVTAGSHLYGLNIPTSDIDTRGIFNLPLREFIKPNSVKQINDNTNDEVHYEVRKFLSLAQTGNPNILEIMFAPDEFIGFKDPKADIILQHRKQFLTKTCRNSLGGYAVTQIKKARGNNKKIVNPCTVRKSPIDFCFSLKRDYNSMPFKKLLELCGSDGSDIGLSKINNFDDSYIVHWKSLAQKRCYKEDDRQSIEDWIPGGVLNGDGSGLKLSSIPKAVAAYGVLGVMHYNRDGFSTHCKEYLSYQEWVENRNPARYATNTDHGKGYDSKNLMHCFRLLNMGIELAETGEFNVYRSDREFLLKVRAGEFEFKELIDIAEGKLVRMEKSFDECSLPSGVSSDLINDMIEELKFETLD